MPSLARSLVSSHTTTIGWNTTNGVYYKLTWDLFFLKDPDDEQETPEPIFPWIAIHACEA
jgi:hypothetical protein